jgi:hypothetical protein
MMAKLVDTYILKADTCSIRISYFKHMLLYISWAFDQLWFYSATRHLIDWTWAPLGSWVPACKNCMLITQPTTIIDSGKYCVGMVEA